MEQWVTMYDYPNYQVSDYGRVQNIKTGRILKTGPNVYGYATCGLRRIDGYVETCMVHKLVAIHFVKGFEDGLQVNHIDGVKTNNRADNLEWVTRKQNIQHAMHLGLNTRNKNKPNILIVETNELFSTQAECAAYLNVSQVAVSKVLRSNGKWTVGGYHLEYID